MSPRKIRLNPSFKAIDGVRDKRPSTRGVGRRDQEAAISINSTARHRDTLSKRRGPEQRAHVAQQQKAQRVQSPNFPVLTARRLTLPSPAPRMVSITAMWSIAVLHLIRTSRSRRCSLAWGPFPKSPTSTYNQRAALPYTGTMGQETTFTSGTRRGRSFLLDIDRRWTGISLWLLKTSFETAFPGAHSTVLPEPLNALGSLYAASIFDSLTDLVTARASMSKLDPEWNPLRPI